MDVKKKAVAVFIYAYFLAIYIFPPFFKPHNLRISLLNWFRSSWSYSGVKFMRRIFLKNIFLGTQRIVTTIEHTQFGT